VESTDTLPPHPNKIHFPPILQTEALNRAAVSAFPVHCSCWHRQDFISSFPSCGSEWPISSYTTWPLTSILKMEAACYSQTVVTTYKNTWCNNPNVHNMNTHQSENLKPYITFRYWKNGSLATTETMVMSEWLETILA
jgi:hypothetical protein